MRWYSISLIIRRVLLPHSSAMAMELGERHPGLLVADVGRRRGQCRLERGDGLRIAFAGELADHVGFQRGAGVVDVLERDALVFEDQAGIARECLLGGAGDPRAAAGLRAAPRSAIRTRAPGTLPAGSAGTP